MTLALIADANGWIGRALLYPGGSSHGLGHISAALRKARGEFPNLVTFALGEWVSGAPAAEDPVPVLLRIAESLGIDAALPGPQDLLLALRYPEPWAYRGAPLHVASDIAASGDGGLRPTVLVERGGLRIGVLGLSRPGIVAATRLRAMGVAIADPADAARRALTNLGRGPAPDLIIGLVNGAWDSEGERATAAVLGLPPRRGVRELADGRLPVGLLVTRGTRPPEPETDAVSIDAVPLIYATPGLVLAHVTLQRSGGVWRVSAVRQESVEPDPVPDPAIVALARPSLERTAHWLAQPTRAIVSGYNRKADFMACAGALSHEAALAAAARGDLSAVGEPPAATLLPMLWRFEPLRKRTRGQPITRAHLHRWMPHDDSVLLARLTGRQIALLLEPYARYQGGWRVTPSLVLHPGGIVPRIAGRATQPDGVAFATTSAPLRPHDLYPVWFSAYHAHGAGGLARKALVQPGQLSGASELPLRELVFRWMASQEFTVPEACGSFLEVAP